MRSDPQAPDLVEGAEDESTDPREHCRARAHWAWLETHHQRRSVEVPRTEHLGGILQGKDLSVGRRVLAQFAFVVALRYDMASHEHYRPHRNVVMVDGYAASRRATVMASVSSTLGA